ncbi:MAG: tetratricopeptide repeat protein [Planctomycetota bacterium]
MADAEKAGGGPTPRPVRPAFFRSLLSNWPYVLFVASLGAIVFSLPVMRRLLLPPGTATALIARADADIRAGRMKEARKLLATRLKRYTDKTDCARIVFAIARTYLPTEGAPFVREEAQEAVRLIDGVLPRLAGLPEARQAWFLLARVRRDLGDVELSRKELEIIKMSHPEAALEITRLALQEVPPEADSALAELAVLETALPRTSPLLPELVRLRGEALAVKGRVEEIVGDYERLERERPGDVDVLRGERAGLLFRARRYDLALAVLPALASVKGTDSAAAGKRHLIGECLFHLGRDGEAVAAFQTNRDAGDTVIRFASLARRAMSEFRTGRPVESLDFWDEALRLFPGEVVANPWIGPEEMREGLLALAKSFYRGGSLDRVTRAGDFLIKIKGNGERGDYYYGLGLVYEELGESLRARGAAADARKALLRAMDTYEILQKQVSHSPRVLDAAWRAGEVATALEEYGRAAAAYRRYLAIAPNEPNAVLAWMALANACEKLGLFGEAETAYRSLVENPERSRSIFAFSARYGIGICQWRQGKRAEAVQTFRRLLDDPNLYPSSEIWQKSLAAGADVYWEMWLGGDAAAAEKATQAYRDAVDRLPDGAMRPHHHFRLGLLLLATGKPADAAGEFGKAAERLEGTDPGLSRRTEVLLGDCLYRMEDYAGALGHYRKGLSYNEEDAVWVLSQMIRCLERAEERAEVARLQRKLERVIANRPKKGNLDDLVVWEAEVRRWQREKAGP